MSKTHRVWQAKSLQAACNQRGRRSGSLPMETHRSTADILDLVEDSLTVLSPDHVTQNSTQEPNAGAEKVRQRLNHVERQHPRIDLAVGPW